MNSIYEIQLTELDYAIDYASNKHLDGDYEYTPTVTQPRESDGIEYPFD